VLLGSATGVGLEGALHVFGLSLRVVGPENGAVHPWGMRCRAESADTAHVS